MNNKKRVLMIAGMPFFKEKGSSLRVYSVLENLSKRYQVDLVTYSLGRDINIPNVNIYRTPLFYKPNLKVSKPTISKIILDFLLLLNVLKLSFLNRYDIIHGEDFEGAFIAYLFKKTSGREKKFVYNLHNRVCDNLDISTGNVPFKRFFLFIEKLIIDSTNLIILNWRIYLKDPVFKDKNKFLYYDRINGSVKKYNLRINKYIVYSGNFEEYQGVKEFLNEYKNIDSNIKLVLVGDYTKNILELIKLNKLNRQVILTGPLRTEQTNYLIKNSLFCVLPRIRGKQPSTKVIHYLMWGKPVLANKIEANQELLEEGKNAIFYDVDSFNMKFKEVSKRIVELSLEAKQTSQFIYKNWGYDEFMDHYET